MNSINKLLAVLILAIAPITLLTAAPAAEFIEGRDYLFVPAAVRNTPEVAQLLKQDPQKTQILFFFSYGCPACNRFELPFSAWLSKHKNENFVVYSYPMAFEETWGPLAKLYYTMKELSPKKNLDKAIFAAIHTEHFKLWQEADMKKFAISQGFSEKDFEAAYSSYNVGMKVEHADHISKRYSISRTPTLVVNGAHASYMLSTDLVGGDVDKFFKVLEFLLKKTSH